MSELTVIVKGTLEEQADQFEAIHLAAPSAFVVTHNYQLSRLIRQRGVVPWFGWMGREWALKRRGRRA